VVSFSAPDATPPVITPTVTGTVGSNGWYTSDVSLSWTVTDDASTVSNTSGCGPSTITTDTAGVTFTCEATSAGGTEQQAVTIKRDATAPIVTTGSPDRSPNAAGWYSAPVTVTFTGQDGTSGIASCTATTYNGPDSATAGLPGTCTDSAGNTSGAQHYQFSYDATKPTLTPTVSPDPVTQGQTATASAGANDALSGVASSNCDPVDTNSVGTRTGTCTATDVAGNTSSATITYTVSAASVPPAPVTTTVKTRAFFALWSTKLSQAQKAALREQVAAIPAGSTITVRATGVVRAEGATKADRSRALKRAKAVRAYLATLGISDVAVSNGARTTGTSAKARRVNLTITWTT
jgi:hypothetical protein